MRLRGVHRSLMRATTPLLFLVAALALGACGRAAPSPPSPASAPTSSSRPEPAVGAPADHVDAALQAALARVVSQSDGHVAVTVLELETGARASIDGGARMPMMSVFKLPLAIVTLAAIDDGTWSLDTAIPIAESELRPNVSPLAEAWKRGQTAPTLETMLRLVLQESDNTAGDKLVTLNGGGAKIMARLASMELRGIDIAEQEIEIAARLNCPSRAAPDGGWTPAAIDACPPPSKDAAIAAAEHEMAEPPNGATADALVAMLARVQRGQVLSEASRRWLLTTLLGTNTGPMRLKGALPSGAQVAHKTGTGRSAGVIVAVNDVGIVTLPSGDHFAIAVLTSGSHADIASSESIIAQLSRASWDAFAR